MLPTAHINCARCGARAPVRYVTLRRIIGMVIVLHSRTASGMLCKDCIRHVYWSYTGTTALVGWWGIKSFILTPFVLVANSVSYIRSWSLAPVPAGTARPAERGWPDAGSPTRIRRTAQRAGDAAGGAEPPQVADVYAAGPALDSGGTDSAQDDLDISAYRPEALKQKDRIGDTRIVGLSAERIDIVQGNLFARCLVVAAAVGLFALLLFVAAGPRGPSSYVAMLSLFPAMLMVGLICCWAPRRKVRIDFRGKTVEVVRASLVQEWPANEFYAVYVDSAAPKAGRLRVVLAEISPTSAVAGVTVAACASPVHEGHALLNLAAAIASGLNLPLKASEDGRQAAAASPRLLVRRASVPVA